MNRLLCHVTALLVALSSSCALADDHAGTAASATLPGDSQLLGDRTKAREVWTVFQQWLDAYAQKRLEQVMAIFDPDVVFSFQGVPDQGWPALQRSYRDDFARNAPGQRWRARLEEISADGRLAYVRSSWELVRTDAQGQDSVVTTNRSIDVLRRDDSGRWRIFRSLNYPQKP
ncbi:YybH family protein [Tahibacter amnicola]|uniref:Nuclear transport factor 2 family protein n=1 Tax=Tahibacter amnicola TaxID=2976241 RepID=A0ABY6BG79_9GAMM|nr:nuclear transport factor 2 family protein [Tahibacter amnicola]UXI68792.1 nuclear transport factor 2 family protein [Tahibacter amnicola]